MKVGNLLASFTFAIGSVGGLLALIASSRNNAFATEIFTTLAVSGFVFAGLFALLTFGISRAADNRLATEVLHP